LTSEGRRAAALLLEYLTLKKLNGVELTGHADERGSDAYNYELSRERLDAVAVLLKDGGYTGRLKLTPKGKSEPYMGVDRSAYTGEALYQLDRRVELRLQR
jgi:outer membrane protein OmpA-like peptidoglycan-associated protein